MGKINNSLKTVKNLIKKFLKDQLKRNASRNKIEKKGATKKK